MASWTGTINQPEEGTALFLKPSASFVVTVGIAFLDGSQWIAIRRYSEVSEVKYWKMSIVSNRIGTIGDRIRHF